MPTRSREVRTPLGYSQYFHEDSNCSSGEILIPWNENHRENLGEHLGTQVTESESHSWRGPKGPPLKDIGGNFFTQKKYFLAEEAGKVTLRRSGPVDMTVCRRDLMRGPIYAVDPRVWTLYPPAGNSSDAQLNQLGATAIARCKPTNSVVDIGSFLGELREGLPRASISSWGDLIDRARKSGYSKDEWLEAARKGGDEYLNVQFGWRPFLSELNQFTDAFRQADKVLSQYERDAGKVVRRRYEFPSQTESSSRVIEGGVNPYGGGIINSFYDEVKNSDRRLLWVTEKTQRQWFSGAFSYYLPSDYDSRKVMHEIALRADLLFGLSLTPETIWELSPWSWAVDWFSNTGDVISNLTSWATDSLVMRYGYMMEHTISKHTFSRIQPHPFKSSMDGAISPVSFVVETKIRRKANPFGFGVSWDGLSPFQLSIAAALGISRS